MTVMNFLLPGGMEWVWILLIALLLFGGSRLAGLGKSAGQAIREFKEETKDLKKSDEPPVIVPQATAAPTAPQATAVPHPEAQVVEQPRQDPPRV